MSTPFPVIEVDRDLAYDVEPLGTKRKFWFRRFEDDAVRWLFKAEERSTGEDWAEKITCELCELLGIPHVRYAPRHISFGLTDFLECSELSELSSASERALHG